MEDITVLLVSIEYIPALKNISVEVKNKYTDEKLAENSISIDRVIHERGEPSYHDVEEVKVRGAPSISIEGEVNDGEIIVDIIKDGSSLLYRTGIDSLIDLYASDSGFFCEDNFLDEDNDFLDLDEEDGFFEDTGFSF